MRAIINCTNCEHVNVVTEDNCVLHAYIYQPAFSWCEMVCDMCQADLDFFFSPTEWPEHLKSVIASEVSIITEDWVTDEVYEEYLTVWCKHLQHHNISANEEHWIEFFAYLINQDPGEWFDD